MKTYQVSLNGRQYSMLEKMLCSFRASQLAKNQCINGYELFSDMIDDIGIDESMIMENTTAQILR